MSDNKLPRREAREVLYDLSEKAMEGSEAAKRLRAELFVTCAEDLIDALESTSKSSDKLSNRLVWLTGILTFATITGVVVAIVAL